MNAETLYAASLILGLAAYLALTVFCVVTWAKRITGRATFVATLVSLMFIVSLALTGLGPFSLTFEFLTILAWTGLVVRVIGVDQGNWRLPALRPVTTLFVLALLLTGGLIGYAWASPLALANGYQLPPAPFFAGALLLAICGLALLEQVVRNARADLRWRLRYLNIGIGTLFAFELIHHACGLLFNAYLPALVLIQPAVFALVAPFIALASLRNPTSPLRMNLSRRFVFGSGVLMGTGILLLVLGLLGYLVRALDGDWGAAGLALLAVLVVMAAATVFGSTSVRARGRRWMEEHLFSSKYDYRDEWRRVTDQLTEPSPDFDLPQQALRALSRVVNSTGGTVWSRSSESLVPLSCWHTSWNRPLSPATTASLIEFFETHEWVLDLERLPESARSTIEACDDLIKLPGIRFVIPLLSESRLSGLAGLVQPSTPVKLDWEDYSLLKLIARQSAGFISLREAERELADADRLNGMSQMSAFIVHDVKTISAQLSLLLDNAREHRSNPAFIDDMLKTTENAVERMHYLLAQIREGRTARATRLELGAELSELARSFCHHQPAPSLQTPDEPVYLKADSSQLRSAIGHLVQNAVDAVRGNDERCPGRVSIDAGSNGAWAEITIADNGPGMSRDFVDKALFQPLTSTKGVAGLGVGAYQARAYVRTLGGDVSVDSEPGRGARVTVRIPAVERHD